MGGDAIELPVKQRSRAWKLVPRLLLSFTLVGLVLWWVGPEKAKEGLSRVSLPVWSGALFGFLSLQALSAMRWRALLSVFGARLPAGVALRCHAAGLFANLCLPSLVGGDLLRVGLAFKHTRGRTELVLGSLCDRVADLAALLTVASLGFLLAHDARERIGGPLLALPVAIGVIVLGALFGAIALLVILRRKSIHRQPRALKRVLVAGRRLLRNPKAGVLLYLAAVALQASFVLVNVGLGTALGLTMEFGLWFLLWPLAKVAAMLPLGFGGLGVREAAFAALLLPLGLEHLGVVQSLVWQSVLIAGGMLAGLWWSLGSKREAES